jgi:WD40 repeat protein
MKAVNIARLFLFIAVLARTAPLTSALQADAIFLLEKSPYDHLIAYATMPNVVTIIDTVSQTPIYTRTMDRPPVRLAWANPDEIVIALDNGSIILWNISANSDRIINSMPDQNYPPIADISVSSTSKLAVAYRHDQPYYQVYEIVDLTRVNVPYIDKDGAALTVAWRSNSTDELAVGGEFGGALVNLSTSQISYFETSGIIRSLDWSSDGSKLLGGGAGEWKIWDGSTGQILYHAYAPFPLDSYERAQWSANDELFALANSSGPIELWIASSAALVNTIDIGSNQSAVFDWDPKTQTLIIPDETSSGSVGMIDFSSSNFNEKHKCSYANSH